MATERSGFPQLLVKNSYKWFFETYDRFTPMYPKLFKVENSTGAYEQSTSAVKSNELREKKEGSEILVKNPNEGFTVYGKNRTFTDAFEITVEMMEDTPTEKIMNILKEFANGWGEGVII